MIEIAESILLSREVAMNITRPSQKLFGLVLIGLLLAGCGGAPTGPAALLPTSTSEPAALFPTSTSEPAALLPTSTPELVTQTGAPTAELLPAAESPTLLARLHWLGHASFRLDGPPTIYFDPLKLSGDAPQADLILISHDHGDHCSPADVKRISGSETVIVTTAAAAKKLAGDVRAMQPGEKMTVGEVEIEAVPAYNVTKSHHPKTAGNLGFIVMVGGERLYFAGDTDRIPEMANITCDVALLPVGGTYTMNAEEAAQAAADIKPVVAVPMHWGDIVGSLQDAERFRDLCKCKVVIMEKE